MKKKRIDKEELLKIVESLYNEFNQEKIRLSDMFENHKKRIQDIEEYIFELSQNDNIDFLLFSPRNVKAINTDKVEQLNEEKIRLIEENQSIEERLGYYCEKTKDLNELRAIEDMIYKGDIIVEKECLMDNNSSLFIQEMERKRISRNLHDSTVQNITHMAHVTELCIKYIDTDTTKAKLELVNVGKELRDIVEEIRRIIFNLQPMSFDDIGFVETIDNMIISFKNRTSANIKYDIENYCEEGEEIVLLTIIRVLQEACNNAIKHAKAKVIDVKIKFMKDSVSLLVHDDGIGFDTKILSKKMGDQKSGIGLIIMRDRIQLCEGTLSISSKIGMGTSIDVKIPNAKKGVHE